MLLKKLVCGASLAALLAAALFSGRSGVSIYANYREVEQLQIIQTMGIDVLGSRVELSISSGREADSSMVMTHSGESITGAIEHIQDYSTRDDMFYAHLQYAIIGGDTAEDDLTRFLDYFKRATQVRLDIGMCVVINSSARELITGVLNDTSDMTEIMLALERDVRHSGSSYMFSCKDISRTLSEFGGALICAVEAKETENVVHSDAGKLTVSPAGYGVIKDGRVCCYILGEQARAVDFLLGLGGVGSVTVETDRRITLSVIGYAADISPVWAPDGTLAALEISCGLNCGVEEQSGSEPLGPSELDELNRALEQRARRWIENTVRLSQELETDFLGLGRSVRASSPAQYAAVEDHWGRALAGAELHVSVSSEIRRTYDMHTPDESEV